MGHIDLTAVNADLGRNAPALVEWALGLGKTSIVTTNFRPFEAVILHMVTQVNPKVPVVWMDNGYNTEATYRFADEVTKQLGLKLQIYLPLRSRAHREAVDGLTPALDDPRVQVCIGDGMALMDSTDERFDLAFMDLTDPDTPASAPTLP